MNVLLIGQGGREHAIAWKLRKSSLLDKLFISPGNAGTSQTGENVEFDINDFGQIKKFVLENEIRMVVVGPEEPLVKGIHDYFLSDPILKNIPVIGPTSEAALLEGSKDFAKGFMQRHNIPTARFKTFDVETLDQAPQFLHSLEPPFVLKADGLAAGKGVLICKSFDEALIELKEMIQKAKFGAASRKVVIEEFINGIECSVFVLTDGNSYKILPTAKDYKRVGEGDTGLNTGGMGSISPVPFADHAFMKKVEDRIIVPTMIGFKTDNLRYKGFIFFGLMNVAGDPYVIEYNVRMGDPEAESVIPRIKSDLLDLFLGVGNVNLESKTIEIDHRFCTTVFLVSGGYPGDYEKGKIISGLENIKDSLIFHAGTKKDSSANATLTNGGRVIAITSFGETMNEALEKSYKNARLINFKGKYYRRDLGRDLFN
jgi:phosphoribosylamine---glycine ligase